MTSKWRDRNQLWLLAGIISILLIGALSQVASHREAALRPTTFSNTPSGLKLFFDLAERLRPSSAINTRRPFLDAKDLAPFQSLVIASPKLPLTKRELETVSDWVKAGGNLILSFHDEASEKILKSFLVEAKIPDLVGDVPGFKNGETRQVSVIEPIGALTPGETYEFYSRLRIADAQCMTSPALCYTRTAPLGEGTVTVFLGLSPFANGLIDRVDNHRLAARLALSNGRTVFDEYHLLLQSKTTSDLLTDPAFFLPVLGLLMGLVLFFVAGRKDEFEHSNETASEGVRRGFHQFNRQIIRSALNSKGSLGEACKRHGEFIERLLPRQKDSGSQIEKTIHSTLANAKSPPAGEIQAASLAKNLIEQHQKWLKSRGRTSQL